MKLFLWALLIPQLHGRESQSTLTCGQRACGRLWKKLLEELKRMTSCDEKTGASRLWTLWSGHAPKAGDILHTGTVSLAILGNRDERDEYGVPPTQWGTCGGDS